MLLLRLPGVYEPEADTHLLVECIVADGVPPGARALDIGTGTGRVALALKSAGAARVQAVDISRRAVLTARCNSLLHRLPLRVHRGDVLDRVEGTFDLIAANPPYVPWVLGVPRHGRTRAWNAGRDGRAVLDRICRDAPPLLRPDGTLWLVHSGLCDPDLTLGRLREAGLAAQVVRTVRVPFGPVLRSREDWLRAEGLLTPDQQDEELVVVRAVRHE